MDHERSESDIISDQDAYKDSAGPFHVFLEHLATYSFPLVSIPVLILASRDLSSAEGTYYLLALIPLSWLAADWITGIVHWMFDTYGSQDMPVFGAAYIRPFREHHVDPKAMTRHSLTVTIGNTCIAATPIIAWVLYPLVFGKPTDSYRFFAFFFTLTMAGAVLTNQFHKWAHMEDAPKPIQFLQKAKIILGPVHHEVHHAKPFDTYYCITCGWMNPILRRLNFWRGMEAMLRWFGVKPYPGIAEERDLKASR